MMNYKFIFALSLLIVVSSGGVASAGIVYNGTSWDTSGSGNSNPTGITMNESYFWVIDNSDDVYKYHLNGTYAHDTWDGNNDAGIAMNDSYFWTIKYYFVDIFYHNGTFVEDFTLSEGGSGGLLATYTDIVADNSYFWAVDSISLDVYKYYHNGTYTGESWDTNVNGNSNPSGITMNGSYFYITDMDDKGIYKYHLNGTYTGEFSETTAVNSAPNGIVINSSKVWITDFYDAEVYEYFINIVPTTPTLNTPSNNSIHTSSEVIELNVSSTDGDGDNITYYFYGGTDPDSMVFLGNNDTVDGSLYNWTISQYDVYYWTARGWDGYEYGENMTTAQFTAIIPSNLTTPINQSTIYTTYPPLTYEVSFDWNDTGAPQYRLQVAEDINFNVLTVDSHISTNNSLRSLLVNKQYWWRVYSYDGTIYSDSSDVYSFNLTGNSTLTGSAIEGVVYQVNGEATAISGAEVTIWNATWSSSMITGLNGYYVFENLNSGTIYNLQAKSDRYLDSSIALVNATSDPVTNNFYLIDDLTDTEWWHYVMFTVQNVWGVTYPDVATKVYIGDSLTMSDSGNTESDGTISFHMNQDVQYRITFINSTLGINEETTLYPIAKSYTIYIDSYSFDLPDAVTDDINAYIASSRINATHGYINFTYSDISDLTTSINYYIFDVDGNELYSTSTGTSDIFNSQIVTATDDRYVVQYIGVHPTHGTIDKTETIVFHGGRRVDFGWTHDWQYAVTALAFLIFIGSMFGAKTAHYGAITVVMFAFIFKWIGWLDETNTSTLLIILAAVIAFGWSLRKSEEVKM